LAGRSCQQSEVYAAESTCSTGRLYPRVEDAQAFIDDLLQQDWWGELFPEVTFVEVTVKVRSDTASVGAWFAETGGGHMDMLPVHLNQLILCHELAHVCAEAKFNSHAHDPWFARCYLELVYRSMGYEAWRELCFRFKELGVDHDVPLGGGGAIAL
jgi:putative metallohydrolase (TIGR04338 family)